MIYFSHLGRKKVLKSVIERERDVYMRSAKRASGRKPAFKCAGGNGTWEQRKTGRLTRHMIPNSLILML